MFNIVLYLWGCLICNSVSLSFMSVCFTTDSSSTISVFIASNSSSSTTTSCGSNSSTLFSTARSTLFEISSSCSFRFPSFPFPSICTSLVSFFTRSLIIEISISVNFLLRTIYLLTLASLLGSSICVFSLSLFLNHHVL